MTREMIMRGREYLKSEQTGILLLYLKGSYDLVQKVKIFVKEFLPLSLDVTLLVHKYEQHLSRRRLSSPSLRLRVLNGVWRT